MICLLLLATYDHCFCSLPLVSHVGKASADSVAFQFAESHFIEQLQPAATKHCAYCNLAGKQQKTWYDTSTRESQSQPTFPSSFSFLGYSLICHSDLLCYTPLSASINNPLISVNMLYWSMMSMSIAQDILFAPALTATPPLGSLF